MKLSSLSVKRRTAKKGVFKKLYANVARKKQRASTAAAPMPQYEGDVPNLGIARALFVILIIHVIAIAGIIAHNQWFDDADQATAAARPEIEPARPLRGAGESLPQIGANDTSYPLVAGDTYARIARENNLTEQELREANGNVELRSGLILRIPAATGNTIAAMEPEELTELRSGNPVLEVPVDEIYTAPMVETDAAAVLVRPGVTREVESAGAPAARPESVPGGATHTVKSGDTFWSISRKYKATPDQIMKANGISDARKLKIGMTLQIP